MEHKPQKQRLSRVELRRQADEERRDRNAPWQSLLLVLVLVALAIVPVAAPGTTQQEMRLEGQQSAVRKAAKKKVKKQAVKKSSSGKTYVVQSGDSWASIAAKHDMTADELAQLNDSTTTAVLSVGQKLKVK